MQPLIDADVLLYEIGYAAETGWQGEGVPPFDYVANLLDNRIGNICAVVQATHPPILYLTGKTNFRNKIATKTKYKERPSKKPFHYYNLKAYIQGKYDYRLTEGLEADDLMAIEQTAGPEETIICTRDKDLRQVPGWHYGWELGNQPQFGPELVTDIGYVTLSSDRKKIKGTGELFFFSQILTGDAVDTIPGLEGCGPVKAFNIISPCKTRGDALKAVYNAYKEVYGSLSYKEMLEQGRLLYMTRNLRTDGSPVMWGEK